MNSVDRYQKALIKFMMQYTLYLRFLNDSDNANFAIEDIYTYKYMILI